MLLILWLHRQKMNEDGILPELQTAPSNITAEGTHHTLTGSGESPKRI